MATLTFHGATRQVTGSCYLIEANGEQVLLECGMSQGGKRDELGNRNRFPFDPRALSAVIISHAHLDHSGLLPKLVAEGFSGSIYLTPDTADLLGIMLKDAAGLQERDAELENRWRARAGKPLVEPLFVQADTDAALALCQRTEYHQPTPVAKGIYLTFHEAGHILGSAIAEIIVEEAGAKRKLVFSGDLGAKNSPLLRDPEFLEDADVIMMESTYGDRDHRDRDATLQELETILAHAAHQGGNVLIPSFAVGRTQDLLYYLGKFYQNGTLKQHTVFLDSPMAIAATEVYDRYHHRFSEEDQSLIKGKGKGTLKNWLPILKCTPSPDESMAINKVRSGAIIIAGAGMCNGGRIVHHFKHNLWRTECHVIFPGFQAMGTVGRRLVDGAKSIRVLHQSLVVNAQLHTLGGFSAHAGQSDLIGWLRHFKGSPALYLVHGEEGKSRILADAIKEQLGWTAEIPEQGQTITL